MATILTKKKDTTGAPVAGDLTNSSGGAELAVNTADKRLYTKDSGGNVVEVGTNPGTAVTFTAGTVSAPAITTTGDTNTGVFFPAADTIAFAEGGAEAMRINSDSQVVTTAGTASLPAITTTGDVNTGIFFPAADTIAFAEGGTEAIRIDSSGNLMVGDTGVDCRLWVQRTTDGNAFGTRATFATYAATVGFFGADRNTTNNSFYYLNCYNYGASENRFRVADSGSISTAGSIQLGDAGAPPTSGVGVKFPATQSASTDANTLDDYEEGTWTPVFTAATTPPTGVTYTTQVARYTKIGKSVTVWGQITLSSKGTGGAGEVRITGLPFTSENVTGLFCRGAGDIASATWEANITQIQFTSVPNNTYIAMIQSGSGQALSNPTWANQNNNSAYNFCITYATST